MLKWVLALAITAALCAPAFADEDSRRYRRHYIYRHHIHLPPERHVIEVVQPPWSGNFIINGTRFTARSASCLRWAAGEPIKLLAGDWHGRCVEAVFYNARRRSTCRMWCG